MLYAYKDFISLINRFIYSFYFAICTNSLHQTNVYIKMLKTTHTQCIAHAAVLNDVCTRAICRTCSRLIVWRRGMAKPIFEYNMV